MKVGRRKIYRASPAPDELVPGPPSAHLFSKMSEKRKREDEYYESLPASEKASYVNDFVGINVCDAEDGYESDMMPALFAIPVSLVAHAPDCIRIAFASKNMFDVVITPKFKSLSNAGGLIDEDLDEEEDLQKITEMYDSIVCWFEDVIDARHKLTPPFNKNLKYIINVLYSV